MASPDSKTRARAEIVALIESHLNTQEKETFDLVTEAELCEYEDRPGRIVQLNAELTNAGAAWLAPATERSQK